MIISHIAYLAILVLFVGLMGGLSLLLEKRKVVKFPGIFIVLGIGLAIFANQKFPFVYTITDCGEYKKEVLIAPTTKNGTRLTLGKKAWINNESDYYLYVEAIVYGYSGKNPSNQEIEPQSCVQAKAYKIAYIFEEPPRSIRTKSTSEVRYWLDCQYEYYDDDFEDYEDYEEYDVE